MDHIVFHRHQSFADNVAGHSDYQKDLVSHQGLPRNINGKGYRSHPELDINSRLGSCHVETVIHRCLLLRVESKSR